MRIHAGFQPLGGVVLLAAAAACLAPFEPLHAQTTVADPQAYREAKRAATATFLDRSRPKAERLEAVKKLGYPEDATLPALLALGIDRTQDDTVRLEALKRLPFGEEYLSAVLKILDDPNDGGEELDAGLIENLSRRLTFRLSAQDQLRIQRVWRRLLDDPRDRVRLYAYRALVANHDPVAVSRLSESLRRGGPFPVPLADAIDLLDQDGSANHIRALRRYLAHADPRVQARAARALALDPESRPRIVQLARSSAAPAEVRLHALRALAREDGRFASYAIPILENERENPDIRYAAMHAFAGRMNYNRVETADQIRFAEAVERLSRDRNLRGDSAEKLREAARKLLLHLREAFPEIRRHYENR